MDVQVMVPNAVENLQLPDPSLLNYYHNLQQRTLWIDTEVDEGCLDIVKKIIDWNKEDEGKENPTPIKIFFFSPGGDLDVNNALIDVITLSKTPIYGYNIGRCYSAAAYIFLSCHKRFGLANAQFVLHQGSGRFEGTYQEVLPQMMAYQAQIANLAAFVSERTEYSAEEVAENIISDWYIDAEEGFERGVYDEIISDMNQLL